jgi:hypothetical protein
VHERRNPAGIVGVDPPRQADESLPLPPRFHGLDADPVRQVHTATPCVIGGTGRSTVLLASSPASSGGVAPAVNVGSAGDRRGIAPPLQSCRFTALRPP